MPSTRFFGETKWRREKLVQHGLMRHARLGSEQDTDVHSETGAPFLLLSLYTVTRHYTMLLKMYVQCQWRGVGMEVGHDSPFSSCSQ